jgi:hypothetical protein
VPVDSSGETQYCVERESICLGFSAMPWGRSFSCGRRVAEGTREFPADLSSGSLRSRDTTWVLMRDILLLNGSLAKMAVKLLCLCSPHVHVFVSRHDAVDGVVSEKS